MENEMIKRTWSGLKFIGGVFLAIALAFGAAGLLIAPLALAEHHQEPWFLALYIPVALVGAYMAGDDE